MENIYMIRGDTTPKVERDLSLTLRVGGVGGTNDMVAYMIKTRGGADTYMKRDGKTGTAGKGALVEDELSFTLAATQDQTVVQDEYIVRRLTPKECERLQGFPDDWTKVPYRGKPADKCPDTPRYKACGNSMAVPVMRWIGERIQIVDEMMKANEIYANTNR